MRPGGTMETERLFTSFGVSTTGLASGHVREADVDGSLIVVVDQTEAQVRCTVLQTGAESPTLVPEDRVLIWHSGSPGDWGVVLGRIGPTHAPPEPETAQAPPLPDELVISARSSITLRVGD